MFASSSSFMICCSGFISRIKSIGERVSPWFFCNLLDSSRFDLLCFPVIFIICYFVGLLFTFQKRRGQEALDSRQRGWC